MGSVTNHDLKNMAIAIRDCNREPSSLSTSRRSGWTDIRRDSLEHLASPFWLKECPQGRRCPDYAASSARVANPKARETADESHHQGPSRHNPGVGIMPLMPSSA